MAEIEYTYTCITNLASHGNYHARWEQIKNVYKPQINTDLFSKDAQYTPHDYSNHCKDIYKILDIIIPLESYEKSITTEQLFYLDVAVIMHDIAMVFAPESRSNHSEEAKKYILEHVISRNDSFLQNILTPEEASFIADIVFGHSDIKDEKGSIILETLASLPNKNLKHGNMGAVNTRMLAGLLRFADELDVNSWRLVGKNLIFPRIGDNSLIHWKKCQMFGFPTISDDDRTIIFLRPNEHKIIMNGDMENDVQLILEVEKKINSELKKINKLIFNSGCLNGWAISDVEIYTDDREISERISKERDNRNPLSSSQVNISTANISNNIERIDNSFEVDFKIEIISEKFSKKVENWVIDGFLLHDGHYYIDDKRYSRDWIDTNAILTNSTYLGELTDIFSIYLNSLVGKGNVNIVGEGFPGIILASSLAFQNGFPLTYHIPHQYDAHHSDPEKNININKEDKIVIVTDVIVTGKTIDKTIETLINRYCLTFENILSILCVFFRPPLNQKSSLPSKLASKIACINSSMPIEICNKNKCLFRDFGLVEHKYKPTV